MRNFGNSQKNLYVSPLTVFDSVGSLWGAATGGPQGAGTINVAGGFFINGVAVATATNVNANNLTGTTLAAGVVNSSLTSVGTLGSLTVSGTVSGGTFSGAGTNLTGTAASLSIGGSSASSAASPAGSLTGATLAAGVVNSSLTSVGTLGNLTVSGTTTLGGGSQAVTTGSFTASFTGFSSTPTPTCTWIKIGNTVILNIPATTATSNAATFGFTGLPAAIQTATSGTEQPGPPAEDNGGSAATWVNFASGTVTFSKSVSYGVPGSFAGWTSSGTKGFQFNIVITYSVL
jgi:hypothetical protein